jgi:hypothetical protein
MSWKVVPMMSHLKGIEDVAARNGVFAFQIEMELAVLTLLDHDRDVALAQVEAMRAAMSDHIAQLVSENLTAEEHAKSERLAVAMLQRSVEHLRLAIAAPNGSGSPRTDLH